MQLCPVNVIHAYAELCVAVDSLVYTRKCLDQFLGRLEAERPE